MKLSSIQYWFTLCSGILVLAGISIVFYATAYLNTGHPPASGIFALFVAMAVTPLSLLSLAASLFGRPDYAGPGQKTYLVFIGIHVCCVFIIGQIWLYKAILGQAV